MQLTDLLLVGFRAACAQVDHTREEDNWAVVEKADVVYSAGFFITVSPEAIALTAKHCAKANKIYCMNLSAPFIMQVQSPSHLPLHTPEVWNGSLQHTFVWWSHWLQFMPAAAAVDLSRMRVSSAVTCKFSAN